MAAVDLKTGEHFDVQGEFCLKTVVPRCCLCWLAASAGDGAEQRHRYTVSLGLESDHAEPGPEPISPIHIVPIVQPEGNTDNTLPTGIVEDGHLQ